MRIDVLTIFPQMFSGPLHCSILKRAQEQGLVEINVHDLRDYAQDKHRMVDDYPYGGGPGMVMKIEPIWHAVESLKKEIEKTPNILLLTPHGKTFNQELAWEIAQEQNIILICGRYEGIDQRVSENIASQHISIGDFVLTGGELPALVVIDAVVRLVPGVLGDEDSAAGDSFYQGILDHPHYTRPLNFKGMEVPSVLLSGNHQKINEWRRKESLRQTLLFRPDLLKKAFLAEQDKKLLKDIIREEGLDERRKSGEYNKQD